MANFREEILLQTRGESQVIDITPEVAAVASRAGIAEGTVNVFAPGATAGISTIEHESGCIRDLQEALERAPVTRSPWQRPRTLHPHARRSDES